MSNTLTSVEYIALPPTLTRVPIGGDGSPDKMFDEFIEIASALTADQIPVLPPDEFYATLAWVWARDSDYEGDFEDDQDDSDGNRYVHPHD
jgi:hypothetical protein